MGETDEEVVGVMRDLRDHRVDVVTIGQYLQPTEKHLPLDRWVTPEQFDALRDEGDGDGLRRGVRRARWCARATAPRSSVWPPSRALRRRLSDGLQGFVL